MNYRQLIGKSISVFFENLINFLVVIAVNMIIVSLLELIGPGDGFLQNSVDNISFTRFLKINQDANLSNMTLFLYDYLQTFILNIFIGANFMAILDLLRGYSYGIMEIVDKIKYYFSQLVPLSAMLTLLIKVLGLVPVIGGILVLVAYLGLLFIFFLLEDYSELEIIDYLKLSYELTKGHKLRLGIMILLIYFIPVAIVTGILFLFIPMLIFGIGPILLIPALLLISFPIIATTMITMIAITIYYEENFVELN